MENHDIDKMFNEAGKSEEENTTFPNFERVWQKVENKLDKKQEKKKLIPIWLPYGIAAGLALTFGVLYFMNDEKVKIEPQISKNNSGVSAPKTQADSLKIQDLDREIQENIVANPIDNSGGIIAYEAPIPKNAEVYAVPPIRDYVINDPIADKVAYEVPPPTPISVSRSIASEEKSNEGVVITAMGIKIEKKSLAYATTTVTKEAKSNGSNTNVLNSLQGKVEGIKINSTNQTDDQKIIIRGIASEVSSNSPLYVIDGIPYKTDNNNFLGNIDPEKINSIEIIKREKAATLFGVNAANGVIVVTTKDLSKSEKRKLQRKLDKESKIQKNISKFNEEEYDAFVENPFENIQNQPLSTFSIDVDKAAYSNIRRMINNGQKVDKNAVRIEEMINYFKYNYPQPKNGQPFSINTEFNNSPWNAKHKILKIGLQGKMMDEKTLPASNLVFLIDVSGSMNSQNKLPLLKESFKVLLEKLRPQDKVALVTYAGNAGVVLEPTSAKNKEKILTALENLNAGGSTAGGEGIELAYKLAQENLVKNGNNRVILATDGDFNMGISDNSELQKLIENKRQSGIYLTCLGFGMGNYKDNRLEMLADKGNGNYAYIDNIQESNKFLGKEFAGSMYAIAKDVKIQIEFNSKFVKSYRLIGYENRKLKNEDFKNDKIDAGELGIGHTVTAIYEIIPVGSDSEFIPDDVDLKYSKTQSQSEFGDELATVKFRYKNPDEDKSKELVQTIKDSKTQFSSTSADFKFATSVAWFGLVLRQSQLIKEKDFDKIIELAKQGKSNDEEGYRSEFVRLVESYRGISK